MTRRKIYNYKGAKANAFGIPIFIIDEFKKRKAKKNKARSYYHMSFSSYAIDSTKKDLVVIYDVPSSRKKERDWLRRQLVNLGFEIIQKSVWVGPSPLPKDFMDYLKEIKMRRFFLTFKLKKPYKKSLSMNNK